MKIIVCVKQVQVLGDEVEISGDDRDLDLDFLALALNEWDLRATEEALRIRDRAGCGEVVVLTVGGQDTEEALRRCLAMGADRAIRAEVGSDVTLDPFSVARAMTDPIRAEDPDLVLTGAQSSDSAQAATGTVLAGLLALPRVAVVTKILYTPGKPTAIVHRELEGGVIDVTEVDLPAVLTVQTGINQPRHVNLRDIKVAQHKEIAVVPASENEAPAYTVRKMYAPPKGEALLLEGSASEIAGRIAEIVRERLA